VTLSADNFRQLCIPPGFAHGFYVTSEAAEVVYKVSSFYDPTDEVAIAWDDRRIGIDWPSRTPTLSERDRAAPSLTEVVASVSTS
jgi:dTDP-4-dehydrorhamnose 3,5-epimerase